MDSSPPSRRVKDLPFYQAPDHAQISSRVIREARNSVNRSQLRSVNTRRPETPQEGQRQLFGDQSVRDPANRPPSAFSLGSRHFDSESRPVSGSRRLDPIDKSRIPATDSECMPPRPPADPNRPMKRTSSRQKLQQSVSIDGGYNSGLSVKGSQPDEYFINPMPSPPDRILSVEYQEDGEPSSRNISKDVERVESGYQSDQARGGSGGSHRTDQSVLRQTNDGSASKKDSTGSRGSSRERRSKETGDKPRNRREHSGGSSKRDNSAGSNRRDSSGTTVREGSAGSLRVSSAGRIGSAGRREEESAEEAQFYDTVIGPVVEKMASHIKERNSEQLMELSDHLYTVLDQNQQLGKVCKRRSTILKTVFKLLDLESPCLLLKQARLILALKVGGNNLVNVCKLAFKVSKDKKNDGYFLEGNILDLFLDTVRTTDHMVPPGPEALIYCLGALKCLSGNHNVVKYLVKKGCIECLALLLISINKTLTGTLRNCAEVTGTRGQFLDNGLLDELCKLLESYQHDADLILNLVRIFSKLTTSNDCCRVVGGKSSNFKALLQLLKQYMQRDDLAVRLGFILGNLTAKSESCRKRLFNQNKGFDILLSVFKHYTQLSRKTTDQQKGDTRIKVDDVLVKIVRVIANLSINEEIGPEIAASDTCIDLLIQTLEVTDDHNEELVLNTIATINNLSYYTTKSSAVLAQIIHIVKALMLFMDVKQKDCLVEATRVLGNLSRQRPVRDFLVSKKVHEMMVAMLDSDNRESVYTSCGVLINLMADHEKRIQLKRLGGITKLTEVLRDFGRLDWQLAGMVCQTLWNYSTNITSTEHCFGREEANELSDILTEYLDEDEALDPELCPEYDEEMREYTHRMWQEEFCPVATQLQERLESHQSPLEPLHHPS